MRDFFVLFWDYFFILFGWLKKSPFLYASSCNSFFKASAKVTIYLLSLYWFLYWDSLMALVTTNLIFPLCSTFQIHLPFYNILFLFLMLLSWKTARFQFPPLLSIFLCYLAEQCFYHDNLFPSIVPAIMRTVLFFALSFSVDLGSMFLSWSYALLPALP